jgi:hypothetical protein
MDNFFNPDKPSFQPNIPLAGNGRSSGASPDPQGAGAPVPPQNYSQLSADQILGQLESQGRLNQQTLSIEGHVSQFTQLFTPEAHAAAMDAIQADLRKNFPGISNEAAASLAEDLFLEWTMGRPEVLV